MKITVQADSKNTENILTLLEKKGVNLPCNCGGRHLCPGNRYSFDCSMVPKQTTTVTLPAAEKASDIGIALEDYPLAPGLGDTLLADIGTTTVALVLMDSRSGEIRQSDVFANPQQSLGMDVISRIQASCRGKKELLAKQIRGALHEHTVRLCGKNSQDIENLDRALIGGNTAMIHLLMGFSCQPLSSYPFSPSEISPEPFLYKNTTVQILPWISAFIGGDTVAGIYACHMEKGNLTSLFMDLGTNGELVLSHKGGLYAASTAAGPALEGAGLSCGTAAVPGAICKVRFHRGQPRTQTIGNRLPVGICGSGGVSLAAGLLRQGLLHRDGTLSDDFPPEGISLGMSPQGKKLFFTPDDLRNLQLAAAAIGAAADALCQAAEITPESVPHIYLGGGFGFFLDLSDCALLRIIPPEAKTRTIAAGNCCLRGLHRIAMEYAPDCDSAENRSPFKPLPVTAINLAQNPYYKERFLHHLTYPL